MTETMALFERARRDAVSLWPLKTHLWKAGQAKFYRTSKQFKAIDALCWWDPTCEARCLADDAACRYADRYGDALFVRTVDGIELRGPTTWFYKRLPEAHVDRSCNRTRRLGVEDFLLLEKVHLHAQRFLHNTTALPLADHKRLRAQAGEWERKCARAHKLIIGCSPACQGFRWLLDERKMPVPVAIEIAAFCGDD